MGATVVSGDGMRIGKVRTSSSGGELDLIGPLAESDSVSIALETRTGGANRRPLQLSPPIVEVRSAQPMDSQRTTGRESATRLDSIYNDDSMLLWGTP